MLHGVGFDDDGNLGHDGEFEPFVTYGVLAAPDAPGGVGGPSAANPLTSIPLLHSNAAAAVKVYLDFDGHFDAVWGAYSNVSTPVYDRDGDATTFSDSELASITEIWRRVSEDFAPFHVDVTTENPGNFNNGVALRVAIGGAGGWLGAQAGGVAYVNTFTNSIVNTVYVFSNNLGQGFAKYVAEASSHESGHGFGLQHQSQYTSGGAFVAEYNPGSGDWAPIMGNSYYAARSTWWNGQTVSAGTYQDDIAVIARSANGFGYRPDDHGGGVGASTALALSGGTYSGSGIIGNLGDGDWFSFTTGGGQANFSANVAAVGANLDLWLELRNSVGQVVASSNPSNSYNGTVSAALTAGTYYIAVSSNGLYGSVGQYGVSGTVDNSVPPPPTTPAFTVGDVSLNEGNRGTTWATFSVELSTSSSQTIQVNYTTANQTAVGNDYTAASGTLTFQPGEWKRFVSVAVRGDTARESNETFLLRIGNATGATIADSVGVGTILNDDGPRRGATARGAVAGDLPGGETPGHDPSAWRQAYALAAQQAVLDGQYDAPSVRGKLRASVHDQVFSGGAWSG